MRPLIPAMEAIKFQANNELGRDLEACISKARSYRELTDLLIHTSGIDDVVKKHTGLTTITMLPEYEGFKPPVDYNAYTYLPVVYNNHIFL